MERLTITAAAKRLRRSEQMVRRWLREGRLRGDKFGEGKRSVWTVTERELGRFQREEPPRREVKSGSRPGKRTPK